MLRGFVLPWNRYYTKNLDSVDSQRQFFPEVWVLFLAWEEHAHQAFLSELPKKTVCLFCKYSNCKRLCVKWITNQYNQHHLQHLQWTSPTSAGECSPPSAASLTSNLLSSCTWCVVVSATPSSPEGKLQSPAAVQFGRVWQTHWKGS